ncbi:helix-turn-helix transcriptional regulator [Nocardiopsis deserti]|uniref:helix-turn-helix transcriptional regulator n=1 Tax=Nocardiopsis deserti TaxID=2605988 RepID=UPI001238FB71|nr:AraC family transcriptional regulator [Nocardiopsis deserti]
MSPPPLRCLTLADAGGVRITDVLCSAARAPLGAEEAAGLPRLVLPVDGVFSCQVRGTPHVVEPGSALLLQAEEPYRFGHPVGGGDACVVVALSHRLWDEAVEAGPPPVGRVVLDPREQLGTLVFRRALRERVRDPDAVRELALIRVGEVLAAAGTGREGTRASPAHRRVACAAASFVAEHHAEPVPRLLDAAAAAAGCSPYHLARVFRAVQGTTLHGFRERLRLASALRALAEGFNDLSALASSLGYASHSHFTERLRRSVDATPSQVRSLLGGRRPSERVPGRAGRLPSGGGSAAAHTGPPLTPSPRRGPEWRPAPGWTCPAWPGCG